MLPLEPWQWCLWIPVLLLAAWAGSGPMVAGLGIVAGLALVALTLLTPWPVHVGHLPVSLLGMAVPLVIGASPGARWDARRALAAVQAERGALTERARIAREMHDVVAHHMSMIAVRCETVPYRLSELPDPARAELARWRPQPGRRWPR